MSIVSETASFLCLALVGFWIECYACELQISQKPQISLRELRQKKQKQSDV